MRKLIILTIIFVNFLSMGTAAQEDTTFSQKQIDEYETQTRQMVKYLEGTLNFIGDPGELPADKDIIFRESYMKLFANEEVQVEDDLDENREQPLNKDVQAYLKDIDFFFKEAVFTLEIEKTEQIITDSNQVVFKITLNRHLQGVTVNNDTINNNQLRYIEINLNPRQKDLKIASIYTTKIREKEEIRNWWNQMSTEWKNYFGKSVIVYDTLPFKNIVWFSDSSIVTMKWVTEVSLDTIKMVDDPNVDPIFPADSIIVNYDTIDKVIPDTIIVNTSTIYRLLSTFRKIEFLDVSNNLIITNLEPLSELGELREIDIRNTLISDLGPLRNLKNLEKLNCSGSAVTELSPIKYLSSLDEINLSKTALAEIETLGGLISLTKIDISSSRVVDLEPLSKLENLTQLDLSNTNINNLSPLVRLGKLSDFNISSTQVTSLASIDSLTSIQHLNIDSTKISDLSPLKGYKNLAVLQANNTRISSLAPLSDKPELKIIYCNNTGVNLNEANGFMDANPGTLVIYNSYELESWWRGLTATWKSIFKQSYNIQEPVTVEKLHQIILKKKLSVAYNKQLSDLSPILMMHRLEKLDLQSTSVSDLGDLSGLSNLEEVNLNNTPVSNIEPLGSLRNLNIILLEKTQVGDLQPLERSVPKIIYCDNSKVDQQEALRFMNAYPSTLIIYQSQTLNMWWNDLDRTWKDQFHKIADLPEKPSNEDLQMLINSKSLEISDNIKINNLNPLHVFLMIKELKVNSTSITDISSIYDLETIEVLDISRNPISQIEEISKFSGLLELSLRNTSVEDLQPISKISQLKKLDIGGTKIKSLKYITLLSALQELYINNTRIKSIKPLYQLPNLTFLQCYNTSIKESRIDDFKKVKPDVEVIFY